MLSCGYEGISISNEVDIDYAKEIKEKINSKSVICGNIDVNSTLFIGNPQIVEKESVECIKKGVDVLGPSCNVAPDTSSMNIKAMVNARNKYYN